MQFSSKARITQIGSTAICSAAGAASATLRNRAAEKKKLAPPKRPSVLPERSSDSSPVSGVSVGSKGRSPGDARVGSAKDGDTTSTCPSPASKRHCPESSMTGSAALKKKWVASQKKAESEVTSGDSATCNDDCVDPTDLVSWPDSATDFDIDTLGEIEDTKSQEKKQRTNQHPAGSQVSGDQTDSGRECSDEKDSQSESPIEGGDASEQQGNDGTSSSGKAGKASPPGKRKVKVDWTPELHRRFVQAVEQLGVEKAIPSRILELMGAKCLTRHNIASHLQKYRSHRRHLAAREAEAANWQQQRKAAESHSHSHSLSHSPSPSPLWPAASKQPAPTPFGWGPFQAPSVSAAGHTAGMPPPGPVTGRPVMGVPQGMPQGMPQGVPQGMHHPSGVVQGMPHPVPGVAAGAPEMVTMGQPQGAPMGIPVAAMGMPVWGHPTVNHSQAHMWQRPGAVYPMPPPVWYGPDGSAWHYPTPFQGAPAVDMWGHPTGGYPGQGVVSGTPCFPPHMMTMHAAPQRMPSDMSSSASASMGIPCMGTNTPSSPISSSALAMSQRTDISNTSAAAGSRKETEAAGNEDGADGVPMKSPEEGEGEGEGGSDLDSLNLPMDNFLDEVLPESIFTMPDDFSFCFGPVPGATSEAFSEAQASNMLDAVISEALANPATPLPLGLKPPSVDGVLEELHRQGITMLPPLKGCTTGSLDIKAELLGGEDVMGEVNNHHVFMEIDDDDKQALAAAFENDIAEECLSEDALQALLDP